MRQKMRKMHNSGFTLIELLVAMAITAIIMTASLTLFDTAMKSRTEQQEVKSVNSNIRMALEFLKDDFSKAGAFMGDQGFFNYYDPTGTNEMSRQFCIDFDGSMWPDSSYIRSAWEGKYVGWYLDSVEDMVEIWYGDDEVFSVLTNANHVQNLSNITIQDNPVDIGFKKGDYLLLYDSQSDAKIDVLRGSSSRNNWMTVLTGVQGVTGNYYEGTIKFDDTLGYTDRFQTPYGTNIVSKLPDKDEFKLDDRVYLVRRIVYGVMTKTVASPETKTYKILIRDDFRNPDPTIRYNPEILATDIDHVTYTTIFKIDPATGDPSLPYNYYNAVNMGYYYNYDGKMYGKKLDQGILDDFKNDDYTDHDPRDLKSIIVEISGVSRKIFTELQGTDINLLPPVFFSPEMGVVEYYEGGTVSKIYRIPKSTDTDFRKHYKLGSNIALRSLRLKDFAVSPTK
jgi:prepilin-type N-terminal cleavage/methylation domain-containing protein